MENVKIVDLSEKISQTSVNRLPNITLSLARPLDDVYLSVSLPAGLTLVEDESAFGCEMGRIVRTEKGFDVIPGCAANKGGTYEFSLVLRQIDSGHESSYAFKLTVNPDAETLWRVKDPLESDCEFPFDRVRLSLGHGTQMVMKSGMYAVGVSRRGKSHEHEGTFRDDSIGMWSDPSSGRYLFVVADGAGSAQYSREGSRRLIETLCATAEKHLKLQLWDSDSPTEAVGDMLVRLSFNAVRELQRYLSSENEQRVQQGKTPYDIRDFSSTFLVSAVRRFDDGSMDIVSFSVGDGAIAIVYQDSVELQCRPDGGGFRGGTRFVTSPAVIKEFMSDAKAFSAARVFGRHCTAEEARQATLLLMSDGVSDPKFESEDGLSDPLRWKSFVNELDSQVFAEGTLIDDGAGKLYEWLGFHSHGNYDDRSLIVARMNQWFAFQTGFAKRS